MTRAGGQLGDVPAHDEMLAERTRQGSGAAFAALVERHSDAVYRIARNMCATSSEAAEVTQQTFLSAYRGIASLQTNGGFRTWLYGIAIETALAGRQGARRSQTSLLEAFLPRFNEAGRPVAAGGEWVELAADPPERMEVTGLLREALECFDDGVRAAFVLCDLADLPLDEAAAILQTSPQAIRQRVHRARLMLRGFLDGLWKS